MRSSRSTLLQIRNHHSCADDKQAIPDLAGGRWQNQARSCTDALQCYLV